MVPNGELLSTRCILNASQGTLCPALRKLYGSTIPIPKTIMECKSPCLTLGDSLACPSRSIRRKRHLTSGGHWLHQSRYPQPISLALLALTLTRASAGYLGSADVGRNWLVYPAKQGCIESPNYSPKVRLVNKPPTFGHTFFWHTGLRPRKRKLGASDIGLA